MSEWHPDRAALQKFLADRLTAAETRALQRHLFLCPACEERLIGLLPAAHGAANGAGSEGGDQTLIRDVLAELRAGRWSELLARERSAAPELWRELAGLAAAGRHRRVADDPRFQTWGLFELLLDNALAAALAEPRQAEEQLRLAVDLADRLSPDRYGRGAVAAAQARAWAYLGNALRILSDFRRAEQAFERAELHLSQSWLDPLDEALLLELKGSLRRAQRRFGEALGLLEDAVALYREIHEPHLQGRALMKTGLALQYQGDFAAAIACFRDSLSLLDGRTEPRLVAASRYNLSNCLFDSGRTDEAAALIPETRRLMEQVGTPSDLVHLRWLEAKVAAARGSTAEAEQAFREAKEAFGAARAAFDAALVALELAALYAREGRTADVKPLAEEILPIFRSCEVPQEALAALIVFQQAAEREQLTLGLVEEVTHFLERVRANPDLRFRDDATA